MENLLTLNNSLCLTYPDGFHILDEEERKKINSYEDTLREGLSDPARHIMISLGWKSSGFLSGFFNAKTTAESMEAKVKKLMQPYSYHSDGFREKSIGSEKAAGFSYEYEAQRIRMIGESYVVKHDITFYYLHFYAREELKKESLEVWDGILSSTRWI